MKKKKVSLKKEFSSSKEKEFLRLGWAPPAKWKKLGRVAKEWQSLAKTLQEESLQAAAWRAAVIATMSRFLKTAKDDVPGQVSARASMVGFIGMAPEDLQTVDYVADLNRGEDGQPADFRKILKGEQLLN